MQKKDSTGICFIGERKFKNFLQEYLLAQPGNIETSSGEVVGQHSGLMFYTLGQRKGIGVGGKKTALQQAWYVIKKDLKRQVLVVAQGQAHPQLYRDNLTCTQVHWIAQAPTYPLHCTAKIRYRQADQHCVLNQTSTDLYQVKFMQAQRAITAGQSIVFYQGDICLGGGIISGEDEYA